MSIKIENLTHIYMPTPFEKKALDNVNVEIKDGEFCSLNWSYRLW